MIDKYRITKYLEFLAKYKFSEAKSRHTADMAQLYYDFAYYQMLSLSETYTEFFKAAPDESKHDKIIEYLHKAWSYAYGMYALLRTSLDAVRIMRKMIGDSSPIDPYWEGRVKEIVDIANDIVKHPTFKPTTEESWAVEPKALSLNGEIDVVVWSDKGHVETVQVDPMKDFYSVCQYLEYIGEKLTPTQL